LKELGVHWIKANPDPVPLDKVEYRTADSYRKERISSNKQSSAFTALEKN